MKSRSHRLPTISDIPDEWVDGSWTVDCVCGVTFDDGEEMVDCDECGVWVHTRCSGYVKSEKLFSCDTCKSKKLRKLSEETEVAQLLVELPTKTLRMDSPYPIACPPQNPFQVWTEVPPEEKVHVQGIPGGDPALFKGVSSVFSPELWKCTGYVPKKFKYQYREFPCWENKQHDDTKGKVEIENHDSNGADALFSLSKENVGIKTLVNGGGTLDMGPPTTDSNKQEVENNEGRRQQSGVRKERSLLKPFVIQTSNQKKDDSKVMKDQNRKKIAKSMEKGDSKKRDQRSFESASVDAIQSESNEGKGVKVFKTDKHSFKHVNSRADLQASHKLNNCLENNNPVSSAQPLDTMPVDDSRPNLTKEVKQAEENNGNQVPPSGEISSQTEDAMTSSLINKPMESSAVNHEAGLEVVDDAKENGGSSSRSNGTRSNTNDLEKVDSPPKSELNCNPLPRTEVDTVEINHPGKTCDFQNVLTSDLKLDSTKTMVQETKITDDPQSASAEVKIEAVYVSQKVQSVDKSLSHNDSKVDESPCGPNQPKEHTRESEAQPNSIASPSGGPNQRKSAFGKPSVGKSSNSLKPSVLDKKLVYSSERKGKKDDDTSTESLKNGVASEKPKKLVKDNLSKSLSTSALKSSNLSKSSSHAPVSKKNSGDLKDPGILLSSKTSITVATPDSGESTNSELSTRGEKTSQLNRQPAPKNHPPHVHAPPSTNSPATLSDEELALLLHQELNSSPRVPRVPRVRHAGSLPQLASTSTSTLMKRTSTSGAKDNGLVSRKKNKDLAAREVDGAKKVDKNPSLPNSRRHDAVKNKVVHPPASTTVSSGPSSSNEANNQNASDDENGATKSNSTHRTLPGLIADIMSKGKRMTYEELCNAVLPQWPNLRKHNGERYAYSSHSQAVLDCLRNRSEWSRLVDRGPKTNAGRKRRKPESDLVNPESEDDVDYSTDRNTKDVDSSEFPKGKRKVRKQRRLALQGRGIKDIRRRRKAEVVSDDIESSSSSSSSSTSDDSSEESEFSDEEMQVGGTSGGGGPNEASASSDEMS